MPELPEVETVRLGLAPYIEGQTITRVTLNRPNLRRVIPADLSKQLANKIINGTRRHGKTMLWDIKDGPAIAWHLGMSGSFSINQEAQKHDHVVITFMNGTHIAYNDPRRFGMVEYAGVLKGVDPLSNDFTLPTFSALFPGKKTPIKSALLDQSLVTGLGNIYVCEALYQSGIHPRIAAGDIPGDRLALLYTAIIDVLNRALASGGSTVSSYRDPNGITGKFQHYFSVYGRGGQSCDGCGHTIDRMKQAGRSTFFCPQCQSAPNLA